MPENDALQLLHPFFMVVSFVLGALVGSFCNVCASRWPAGESVISPRSRCPRCKTPIAWFDNIPLISWLLLGAKCRHCSQPISWQYPLVEALTGVLFFCVYWRFGFTIATPVYMLYAAALVVVTFQDLADWTIPNEITFPGIPLGLVLALVGMAWPDSGLRVTDIFDALLGIVLGGGILYTLDRVTVLVLKKPGMGFGDVKLLAMIGAFLGWQGVLGTLMMASVVGSAVGIAMILYFRAKPASTPAEAPVVDTASPAPSASASSEGHYLPFGPYLALGGLLFMFFGPELIAWYFGTISLA